MKQYEVTLVLKEALLGTGNANPDVHREFISSKCEAGVNEDEIKALPDADEAMEKSTTVFYRDEDGIPVLFDYQIKGFFKDACGCLRRCTNMLSKKCKAYKKVIDGTVFVEPRMIQIDGAEMTSCVRPLRAQTAQGERVALATSEAIKAGASLTFTVTLLDESCEDLLYEWLEYGKLRGLGQWRNSGKGRFDATIKKL